MANSYTLLADLRAGRCSKNAEVRLLRFWEARNINKRVADKRGELMSLELLLIDENSTLIQGSIAANREQRFRHRLTEGSIYALNGFDVTRSNTKFRLSDAPISVKFNDGTSFEEVLHTARVIPTELFRFRSYEDILALANTGRQLPDIMGELSEIRSTITDRLPGSARVMLSLRLESDQNVCVSLFDGLALAFHSKFDAYGKEPKIVLVTGINPKLVSGKLYLNGTSASRIYFDAETAAGKEVFDRLPSDGTDQSSSSSKVVHAQKIEPLTVSELNEFILTAEPQIIEFLCTAKVIEVQKDEGWCYIGCSQCSKKLVQEETSFTCLHCNRTNAVAELKYRVIFGVSDDTGVASFLAFDLEVAKLTHVLASEAAQIVGTGISATVDTQMPQTLAGIVGSTYTFQLRLTHFNFTSNHQTFTISRIFPKRELAPLPTFAEDVEAYKAVLPESQTTELDARGASTSNVADATSTTDGPLPARLPAATEDVHPEEKESKKARVE